MSEGHKHGTCHPQLQVVVGPFQKSTHTYTQQSLCEKGAWSHEHHCPTVAAKDVAQLNSWMSVLLSFGFPMEDMHMHFSIDVW